MDTLSVSEFVSTYSKFIQEAVQEYAEKNKILTISAKDLKLLTPHVVTYCTDKIADSLLQIPESNNGVEREQEILEEEKCFEQGEYMEPAEIHQSSTGPFEIPESNHEAERIQKILEEDKCFDKTKCVEPAQLYQSSTGPSQIAIDLDPFIKLMTEHHKQQQEFQDKIFKTLLDHLNHQHAQQEQNQQQQNKVCEQFLQHQQDFQSKLMGDFMKHTEVQAALFCQTLSNSKTEQSVYDHVNVDKRETECYKPSSPETTYNSSKGHNSFSGGHSAEKSKSSAHLEVSHREKQPFQIFDCHKLGQEFCKWFYNLLNSQNPSRGQERLHWDLSTFWSDAVFAFVHDNSSEKYFGDECVSSKLLEITQKEKLTFTPTLDSKRFKCVNSRHGLVVVAVTGVISNNDNYSGVFNQIFGLIKCPSTGNYKIKSIHLRVDNMSLLLSEHKLHVPPLQYTTEQLQDFEV